MSSLKYRPDADDVRKRLAEWWNGGDIGRPAMQITTPRPEASLRSETTLPTQPEAPSGSCPQYTTLSLTYRVERDEYLRSRNVSLGEDMPTASPCLGPNCLALYLGCTAIERPDTVWFETCIKDPDKAVFEYDPDNHYWDFQLRLIKALLEAGKGKYLVTFPDLIEGLDTLAAMRGSEPLLIDLMDRPEWVHESLDRITDLYIKYYDTIYELIKDETGGSHFWAWAPGKMAKFQCDFSAMISPAMFNDFMVPILKRLTEHVDYCMYHWDGPGAIPHHDALLSIPGINMIQWTPGDGVEGATDPRWWPLFHKTIDAGKKVLLTAGVTMESLAALKREFGPKLKQFMFTTRARTPEEAQAMLDLAMVD
jgi:hypothetical protein